MFRNPNCLDNRLRGGDQVVSLTCRPSSTPQEYLLVIIYVGGCQPQDRSAPRGSREIEKKFNYLIGIRNRDLPVCSFLPQQTTLLLHMAYKSK
jgi:hypothetical protein